MQRPHTDIRIWLFLCLSDSSYIMTSLAHQLKRLALPQSDANLLTRSEVASLLFDPKEAASMDRSTFYALGESRPPLPLLLLQPVSSLTFILSVLFLVQDAPGWRSYWESSRHSWSFRAPCSVPPRRPWSAASNPRRSTRSWMPASRSSSPASAHTSFSNRLTSASSGSFTGKPLRRRSSVIQKMTLCV